MFNVHFQMHQKRQGTNIDLVEQFNIYEVPFGCINFRAGIINDKENIHSSNAK